MPVAMRPFAGETDVPRMIALAHERPADQVHLVDLPYRLSSSKCDKETPGLSNGEELSPARRRQSMLAFGG
jgi:hypothetical protein